MLLVRCMLVDFGILFGIVDAGLSVQHQPNLSDVTLPCPAPTAFLAWYTWVYPKLHADSKEEPAKDCNTQRNPQRRNYVGAATQLAEFAMLSPRSNDRGFVLV